MERNETLTAAAAPRREVSGAYVDWASVLGGAVVATALGGLFATFGAALGLSTLSAEPGESSVNLWLFVTAIWIALSLVVSFLAGGYIAGRMRRRVDDASADEVSARDGINGLVVWGLGMILTAWMAAGVLGTTASAVGSATSAVGSVVGGAVQGVGAAVGGAAQGVAQAVGAAVPEDASDDAMSYITDTLMRPVLTGVQQSDTLSTPTTPSTDNAELARQSGVILGNVLRTGEISDDDRAFLTAAVAQRTGLSQAEVEARVTQAVDAAIATRDEAAKRIEDARAEAERLAEEAKQAAIDAAEAARKNAILTAFLLAAASLVAAAASVIGGVRGGVHRDEGRIYGGLSYRR